MITTEIKSVDIDANGNIRVTTEYKKDGLQVQIGNTRYSMGASETEEDVKTKILADIKTHAENLVSREYVKNANITKVSSLATWGIGQTDSATEATLTIGDNVYTVDETSVKSTTPKVIS